VSGVWLNSAGPSTGISDRTGTAKGWNGSIFGGEETSGSSDPVGVIGQARGKQRDADAGDMLRQAERHGEETVQQPEGIAPVSAATSTPVHRSPPAYRP
jgi:hypothetical protein